MSYSEQTYCLDGLPRTFNFVRTAKFDEIAVGQLFYHPGNGLCLRVKPTKAPHSGAVAPEPNVYMFEEERVGKFGGFGGPYWVE